MKSRNLIARSPIAQWSCALFASALFVNGGVAYGVTAEAEKAIKEMPIIDVPQTAQSIDKVRKLEAEGERYFAQSINDKALQKWQEAYGLSIEMRYTEGEGRALTNMARCYLDRGEWIKAKYLGENSLEVLQNSNDTRALGRARVALAQAYFGLGNNDSAGEQLSAAIKTMTNSEGTDSVEAGRLLNLAGNLLLRYGKVREAVQFFQNAATYFAQGNDAVNAVKNNLTVASILEQSGMFTASLEESQKAVTTAKNIPNAKPGVLIAAVSSLANGQYVLGEFSKARKTYEQVYSLIVSSNLNTKELPLLSRANVDLGYAHCLSATGDLEQAKKYFERAIAVFRANAASTSQAQSYNGMGIVEELQGQHSRALEYFKQALDLQGVVRPPQPRMQLALLHNLAAVETRSNATSEARGHLESALGVLKKNADPVFEARTYSALAEVYYKLADATAADKAVKKAIELGTAINDDASLWRDYLIQARIQLAQGEQAEAKESLNSALSFFRSPQAGAFASPERLVFPTSREDMGEQLVALAAHENLNEQALLAAEQLKDEIFTNDWSRRGGQVRADDRDLYNDLSIQRAHLHAAELSESPSKLSKDWQQWLVRFRTLVAQNRSLARMIAPVPTRTGDLIKAIQISKATFVEYLVGADSSVIFTIDGAGRLSATVVPVGRSHLQKQVTSLLGIPANIGTENSTSQRERAVLQSLYTELFPAAVRNLLPKGIEQSVCIIPDGVLFNLPFAALVDEKGKYLIEEHTMTLGSSIGALLDIPAKYADDHSILAIYLAYPANTNPPQANLPDETNSLQATLGRDNVTRLVGREADVASLRDQAHGKAVLHFANYINLLSNNPFNTVIPLIADKATNTRATADSLFSSSLASDLAVLSDSSVNPKDPLGNSIRIFSRGLNYAGVRNVMVSLWVSPSRMSELVEFYKLRESGLTQAQALRKAEMSALAKDPSPHTWASFQLIGPGY